MEKTCDEEFIGFGRTFEEHQQYICNVPFFREQYKSKKM